MGRLPEAGAEYALRCVGRRRRDHDYGTALSEAAVQPARLNLHDGTPSAARDFMITGEEDRVNEFTALARIG